MVRKPRLYIEDRRVVPSERPPAKPGVADRLPWEGQGDVLLTSIAHVTTLAEDGRRQPISLAQWLDHPKQGVFLCNGSRVQLLTEPRLVGKRLLPIFHVGALAQRPASPYVEVVGVGDLMELLAGDRRFAYGESLRGRKVALLATTFTGVFVPAEADTGPVPLPKATLTDTCDPSLVADVKVIDGAIDGREDNVHVASSYDADTDQSPAIAGGTAVTRKSLRIRPLRT